MELRVYKQFLPYGVSIISTLIAFLLTLWMEKSLTQSITTLFFITITISTWNGGMKPGFLAIVLAMLLMNYYFIEPRGELNPMKTGDFIQFLSFCLVAITVHLLNQKQKNSQFRMDELDQKLLEDEKIQQLNNKVLEKSDQKLQTALNAAQMGMWEWDLITGEVTWSVEQQLLFGLIPGTFGGTYESMKACIHPDDFPSLNQSVKNAVNKQGSSFIVDFRALWPDSSTHWLEGRGSAFSDATGKAVRILGTVMVIEERKQTEKLLQQQLVQQRLILEISQNIRRSLNLSEILQTTVDEVRHFLDTDRVIIFQLSELSGTVVSESVGSQWQSILSTEISDPCFMEQKYIERFQEGLVTAKTDIYNADISDCHVTLLTNFQVKANLVVPIIFADQLWGLLIAHHCASTREWESSEIDLLVMLANKVGMAIQQSMLFQQIQRELIQRKEIQAALHESESRLRLAQVASNSGVWDWDITTNNIYWSDEFYQLYEIDQTVVATYENWLERVCALDQNYVNKKVLESIKNGESELKLEFRVLGSNGLRWFTEIGKIMRNEAGDAVRTIGITIDITAKKEAELALQALNNNLETQILERTAELNKSQALIKKISELNPSIVTVHDVVEHRQIYINPGVKKVLGYTAEFLHRLQNPLLDTIIHPDDRVIVNQVLTSLVNNSSDEPQEIECRIRHANGTWRWFYGSCIVFERDQMNKPKQILQLLQDITEIKNIEETLRKYEKIIFTNKDPMLLIDLNYTYQFVNQAYLNWYGKTYSEIMGYFLWEIIGQEFFETFAKIRIDRCLTGEIIQDQSWFKNPQNSNSFQFMSVTYTPYYDEYQNVTGVVIGLHDITEVKQAEESLRQQSRQEYLLRSITQAIRQSLDLKAILNTTVNEVRQTLLTDRVAVYRFHADWSGDFIVESVGLGWVKLVDIDLEKAVKDNYLQENQGGRFRNNEVFTVEDIYKEGVETCHIELLEQLQAKSYAIAPIFSGEVLWGLLAIYQNTTPRQWQSWEVELLKQSANQLAIAIQQSELYQQLQKELQERKQAEISLRESTRRWKSLFEKANLAVVSLDTEGNVQDANPFFLQLTGYTDIEVINYSWFDLFVPPEDIEHRKILLQENMGTNFHSVHQSVILTKKGDRRVIAWNNAQLLNSEGAIIGITSIGEDITERQAVEKLKDEFISIVSHELRTPLTSIRGALGLLVTGVMDDDVTEMKRMIQIASLDTERLVRLVSDMLDLEKLETGRISLVREWCDANELICRSIEVMESSAQGAGVTLTNPSITATIWVAPDQILQTLTNLISNAIKFSPPGATVHITAELINQNSDNKKPQNSRTSPPTHILFSVQDQGRGIPSDKLEAIFGRFQQVDLSDSRDKGGTGLGLAICKSIVQQHHGEIWVESILGKGSTFFFSLPLETV